LLIIRLLKAIKTKLKRAARPLERTALGQATEVSTPLANGRLGDEPGTYRAPVRFGKNPASEKDQKRQDSWQGGLA
jgi:hypothetical protein